MKLKYVLVSVALLGIAYWGFDKWKRRNNKVVEEGSFTIEVEPIEEGLNS